MSIYLLLLISMAVMLNLFSYGSGHGDYNYHDIEAWGNNWPICNKGKQQSPINLKSNVKKIEVYSLPLKLVNYHLQPRFVKILNDGHTANLTGEWAGETPYITGKLLNHEQYRFLDMHAHWSSENNTGTEHAINGEKFTVEVHLVHVNKKYKDLDEATHYPDGIAVVGILFKVDPNKSENPGMFMLSVLDAAISKVNSSVRTEIFDFSLFNFHEFNSFYTYSGSLTTPPCTENVRWIVLKEIFPISELSVKAYRRINLCDHEHFNIRPLQPINKRTVTLYTLKEKRLPNLCSKLFSNFQISLNRGKI